MKENEIKYLKILKARLEKGVITKKDYKKEIKWFRCRKK